MAESAPTQEEPTTTAPDNAISRSGDLQSSPTTTSPTQLEQQQPPTTNVSVERGRSFLRRKSLKKKSAKHTRPTSDASLDSQDEAWEALSKTSTKTTVSSTGSNTSKNSTGRHHAPEYTYQEQPHFIIASNTKSVCVILSGFGIKLYEFKLQDLNEDRHPDDDVKCLSILLKSNYLIVLSLPHLQPIARIPLPRGASRLNESSLTTDGRILLWTGKYDMQEWMYIHSETSLPFGHSVELFDIDKRLPPHPCKINQKSTKKTWFGAVAGAFKKEPLTLDELDMIMGRINTGITQQEPTQSSSTGIKKSGLFKELGDKMDERGERLNILGKKFSDMNDASGDFLKAVKDYNERQAQKKWWEF
ncbi:hypothetical protein BC941DRAFT_342682 [Chlamydoabsidia padenii]|nr:hypothetical protein BC941DRAFT_342682 [Chlamydoabsidia padenii]